MGVPHIDSCICDECMAKRNNQEGFTIIRCKDCGKHFGSIKTTSPVEKIEGVCLSCTLFAYCLECKKPFAKPQDWGYCNDCCDDPMGQIMPRKKVRPVKRTVKKIAVKNKRSKWPRVKGDQVEIDYDCLRLPLDDGRILKIDIGSNDLFDLAKELLKSEVRNKLDSSSDQAYKVQAQHAMGCVRCNRRETTL